MNIIFFIPPLLILAYLAYRNTNYGIYVILATIPGYLLRGNVWLVPTTWLELAIYTVSAISLYKHVRKKTLAPHWYYALHGAKHYIIPALIFLFAALVSVLASPDQMRALGIIKAWFFDPLLFSILLLDKLTCEKVLKRMLYALSFSSMPIMLYGIFEYALGVGLSIPGRLDSFFESPNYVSMYLASDFGLSRYLATSHCPMAKNLLYSVAYRISRDYHFNQIIRRLVCGRRRNHIFSSLP